MRVGAGTGTRTDGCGWDLAETDGLGIVDAGIRLSDSCSRCNSACHI
jgi:hypothetical protein